VNDSVINIIKIISIIRIVVRSLPENYERGSLMREIDASGRLFLNFGKVALFNGIVFLGMTAPALNPDYNMSRVIAGGSAGTWLAVGYYLFLIVGVCVIFLCGAAYSLVKQATGRIVYSSKLAGLQLLLMEVGVLGACGLLYYAGFISGRMLIAKMTEEVHPFLVNFVQPIGIFVAIGLLGGAVGIISYTLTLTKGRPQ